VFYHSPHSLYPEFEGTYQDCFVILTEHFSDPLQEVWQARAIVVRHFSARCPKVKKSLGAMFGLWAGRANRSALETLIHS
jgi:hypothetical protein